METDDDGYPVDLSDEQRAFQRLYGLWDAFDPDQAKDALVDPGVEPGVEPGVGPSFDWWVCGGWAIEAYTGVRRDHEDIDIGVFRRDLPALRDACAGRYHVWAVGPGGLCPLDDRQMRMPAESEQVWLRAHALSPWRADIVLTPDQDGDWQFKRDLGFVQPLDVATWTRDGIRYLQPELVLAFKAKHARPKDELDFGATVPLLDGARRAWLAEFIERCYPQHPWNDRLRGD